MTNNECYSCNGTGYWDCNRCNGTGGILCPRCHGAMTTGFMKPCKVCQAFGVINCNGCGGRGVQPCRRCGGTGFYGHQVNRTQREETRVSGTVKWFNPNKGFGFIASDSGEDVFVSQKNLDGVVELQAGDRVEFACKTGNKGLWAAVVRKV